MKCITTCSQNCSLTATSGVLQAACALPASAFVPVCHIRCQYKREMLAYVGPCYYMAEHTPLVVPWVHGCHEQQHYLLAFHSSSVI